MIFLSIYVWSIPPTQWSLVHHSPLTIMALFLSKKTPSPTADNTLPMHGDHGKTRLSDSCHQSEGDGLHVLYTLLSGNEALKSTRHLYI